MFRIRFKRQLIFFYFIVQIPLFITAQQLSYYEIELDNPWLGLTAIKNSYPDITGDIFFDEEEQDWCIQIRNINFYWAHGRLLKKKDTSKWKSWQPFISYYYENSPRDPKYYTKNLIEKLKPKKLITERRNLESPNYSFHKVVYEGRSKKEIIKQLKRTIFLGQEIWAHKRIVKALKNVERKILETSQSDLATNKFLKKMAHCWCFNWRPIKDSGKLSNHSWGTAIDVVPKNYRNYKIYWYWEASKNPKWMLIPPERRWAPPAKVVQAFQSEGFIWGGNWHIWDTMHFEYRPELLYISKIISSEKTRPIVKINNIPKEPAPTQENKYFPAKGNLSPIMDFAETLNYVKNISDEYLEQRIKGNEYVNIEEDLKLKGYLEPIFELANNVYCVKNMSETYVKEKIKEKDYSKIKAQLRAKGNLIPILEIAEKLYFIKNISADYTNQKSITEEQDD